MAHVTEESGVLPSLAVTVTVTTGVVPWSTGEGANEAVVEVEICPNAEPAAAKQIAESSAQRANLYDTDSDLRLCMPDDLPRCNDVFETALAKYLSIDHRWDTSDMFVQAASD
jgi:hypothetical protein